MLKIRKLCGNALIRYDRKLHERAKDPQYSINANRVAKALKYCRADMVPNFALILIDLYRFSPELLIAKCFG